MNCGDSCGDSCGDVVNNKKYRSPLNNYNHKQHVKNMYTVLNLCACVGACVCAYVFSVLHLCEPFYMCIISLLDRCHFMYK